MTNQRRSAMTRLLAAFLLASPSIAGFASVAQARQVEQPSASTRLAGRIAHMARRLVRGREVTPEAAEGAMILAEAAAELDTGNAELQRLVVEVADLIDKPEASERAIRRIVELEPDNTAAQLARLNAAIDQYQNVESRAAAYEQLLRESNRARMHPAVASRLATDLALVRRREGNTVEFARWLTEAMTLDPSNPIAAAIAVEFHGESGEDDPIGRAELLINLVMTNPTDHLAQVALARLLLEQGAYTSAVRLYNLAAASRDAAGLPAWLELEIDRAIALWGVGSPEAAMTRINQIDAMLAQSNPASQTDDQESPPAAPHASLLAIRAALAGQAGRSEQTERMHGQVVDGYTAHIDEPDLADQDRAARLLEAAWIAVWLLQDSELSRIWLNEAREIQPLTEIAETRFSGWMTFREGAAEQAAALLQPVADRDDAAKLGYALALQARGDTRNAATALLDIARRRAGSLIGVWAADRLAILLDRRVPLTNVASRLDALISAIPTTLDRYPEDPRMAVSLSVRPTKRMFAPFEPITVEVELSNRSSRPLAIGRDGPILPHLYLRPRVTPVGAAPMSPPREIIVDLARTLRIEPRKSLRFEVELRRNCLDSVIGNLPLDGALLQVEGIVNFIVLPPSGVVAPGLLGMRAVTEGFRVRGVIVDEPWYTAALAVVSNPRSADDVQLLALLAHAALRDATPSGMSIDEIARRIAEGFGQLRPAEQAWVLSVMPEDPRLERVLAAARPVDHPLVRMAYIAYQVQEPNDPMLDAAMRSEGPRLRRLAEIIRSVASRATATTTDSDGS